MLACVAFVVMTYWAWLLLVLWQAAHHVYRSLAVKVVGHLAEDPYTTRIMS